MAPAKYDPATRTEFVTPAHAKAPVPDLQEAQGEATLAAPLRFGVAYTLDDYLGILREHVAGLLKKDRRSRRFAPGMLPALACALVAGAAHLAGVAWLAYSAAAAVALIAAFCLPFMLGPWVALVATPIFLLKRWRMGACDFTFDEERIERVTARGHLSKTWRDVLFVHRYSQGYLVVLTKGAIPIPYRCLDMNQSQRLRALVAGRPR
jgi:hypothetical protein